MDRRRLLKAGAVTAGLAAVGVVPGTAATATPSDWDDLTLREQLNVVRDATRPYKRLGEMAAAGYVSPPLPLICGKGYHFDNLDYWDKTLDPRHPESVFYVFNESGTLTLGGAEYILVTDTDANGDPVDPKPDLFNDESKPLDDEPLRGTSEADGWVLFEDAGVTLWTLHVWVHERNAEGVFHPDNARYAEMPGCQ